MEIRVIMYINLFLLTGYAIGLSIIGFHNRRFRQFFWFTAAYFGAGVGTVLRMRPRNLPDFFSLVLSNLLVIAALLLIHRCFAAFVKAKANIHWIEACILAGTAAGMIYYAEIRPSFNARSLVITLASVAVAALSASVLIRYADAAVRTPCLATAALYIAFALMLMTRGVWIAMRGGQHDFFDYSPVHLMGFLGFDVLIAGVPLGYFWMTSARLYANQELLARTDSLTNLPNRRALEEFALREMERSRRNERPLAILVIDLDHFKRINDQYGHDAGDAALGAVAKALAAVLRMQDVLARLGGEEFVVLLPDTDKQSAMMIAQRLRETIGSLRINCGHGFLSVTASLGIALFRNDDTLETALRRADRALYTAKLAGRNNVMQESCFQQLPAIEVNDAYHRPFDASH